MPGSLGASVVGFDACVNVSCARGCGAPGSRFVAMNESQRAMIAAKITNLTQGGDRKCDQAANLPVDRLSQGEAARLLNVLDGRVAISPFL